MAKKEDDYSEQSGVQCTEWPCGLIKNFGYAIGLNVMKRTIPLWRSKVAEHGDEKGSIEWARTECQRYHCPSCGNPLFRGAQGCRACGKSVGDELDGSLPKYENLVMINRTP